MDDPGGQSLGLAPITLADKPYFDRVLSALKQPISDDSFANTYSWHTSLKLYWARIERHLCVFANGTGDLTMLKPPMPEPGAGDGELRRCLETCFEIMDGYNAVHARREHSRIEYVSDELLERLQAVSGRGLTFSASPMHGDYVYDTRRMIDLAGGALKSKRHARSRFVREFPNHRVEPMDERHVPGCIELLGLWQSHGDATHEGEVNASHIGSDILRLWDTRACEIALRDWRALGLTGMALLVDERLIGFTFGEALSPLQVSILIEKTHSGYPGAAQFIFAEFCRQCWSHYPECNVGDDWGIPSLRFTKQSYRPIRVLNKSILTRQPVVAVAGSAIDIPVENPTHSVTASAAAAAGAGHRRPTGPTLAPASMTDVSGILALEQACFSTVEEMFNRRQVRYLIADPRATVTVARQDGRVVGWAVGLVRQHRRGRSGRLYAVAVHPDAQGRDLGRGLVEHTLRALAYLGIDRVYLEVRAGNAPAIGLYRKLGFSVRGGLPHYYGPHRHGLRMTRRLSAMRAAGFDRAVGQMQWPWADPVPLPQGC